jgi:adenosylcobinamide-GDP ribazoletransferase
VPSASVRAVAGALTFLTRLPLGRRVAVEAGDVARGVVLFPVVGAGIGAVAAGAAAAAHPRVPALAAAGLGIAAAVLLSGAMHVDALADTADAAGAPSRDAALAIMRDPRIGSFGASALILDLIVKAGAVGGLLERGGALAAWVAAGALSRAASPALAVTLRYPRSTGGPGSVLSGRVAAAAVAVAAVVGVGTAVAVAGVTGAAMAGAVAASTVGLGLLYRRWLGGATGDCLGAATELGETVALVVAVALA